MKVTYRVGFIVVLFLASNACAHAASPLTPLQSASSLTSSFVAGRMVNPFAPDGAGGSAFLQNARGLTECNGKLYFNDDWGLRETDPATGRVTTLTRSKLNGVDLWCDGANLYATSNVDAHLTVEQITIATLERSSFSYPQVGSLVRPLYAENVFGQGNTLYTTDSIAGRIWKIDLATRERSVVIDFGGPSIIQTPPVFGRPSIIIGIGQFRIDGNNLYFSRLQSVNRLRLDTGEVTSLLSGLYRILWGSTGFLYVSDSGFIRKLDLGSGQLLPFVDLSSIAIPQRLPAVPTSAWWDDKLFYFTDADALLRADTATGQVKTIAGDTNQRVDGAGGSARFAMYLHPADFTMFGDSRALYIAELGSIRKFDKASGALTTLAANAFTYVGGVWGDGTYLYVSSSAIQRVDPATKEVRTIAGNPAVRGFVDGVGAEAQFDMPGEIWGDGTNLYVNDHFNAIRKVELATGQVTTLVRGGIGPVRGMWATGRSLYFCDTRRVRRLDLDTLQMETIAGGDEEGSIDGVGTEAQFTRADGIWGDGAFLYVTDAVRRIRRIDLTSRAVTTLYSSAEILSKGLSGDSSGLYVMEGYSLRRLAAETGAVTFATEPQGLSVMDVGLNNSLNVIHSKISVSPGNPPLSVTAIWGYRNPDGVLVSEASVSAQAPIRSGRIYAEVGGSTNTGIAMSNPANQEVRVDFFFSDSSGNDFRQGSTTLPPHGQIARFLNEAPFSGGSSIHGTFSFSASTPVAAVAIRGFTNERSDFLMTTLPVADLAAPIRHEPVTLAHYASGGGWRTQLVLVNPTDEVLSGTVSFVSDTGQAGAPISYLIAARSSGNLSTNSDHANIEKGSVLITPDGTSATPTPLVIFGYAPVSVTLTETGVAAAEGTDFAGYVEATGPLPADSITSGIAIANTTDAPVIVALRLARMDGQPFGQGTNITLQPRAQISKFLPELFPTLQLPFSGVLHISSQTRLSVTGIRSRYNSRNEFIVATVTPVVKDSATATEFYLPHLVTGNGYSTRLFFINPGGLWNSGSVQFMMQDGTSAPVTTH